MLAYSGSNFTIDSCYSLAAISGTTYFGFIADSWASSRTVSNSYFFGTTLSNKGGSRNIVCTNVYGENANYYAGVTELAKANMQGEDALVNFEKMPALANCGSFVATEGYPVLSVFKALLPKPKQELWSESVKAPEKDPEGGENDYLISTPEELSYVIKNGGGKSYKLTNDIYLNDPEKIDWSTGSADSTYISKVWYTASTAGNFYGTLDGDGHTIYGLYVNNEEDCVTALRVVLINNTAYSNGDNNRDGVVDICDLVKLASAFALADMEEIIETYGSYYGIEMKLISDEIDAIGEDAVNYIFISDIHYTNTNNAQDQAITKQLEAIAKMANADDSIDFVVVGGDLTSGGFGTKAGAITANNNALAPLKACTKPVLVLAGNHDDNCYHVYSGDKVYKKELILSDMDWTTKVLALNSPSTIVHDANYENSKYYYYDLPEKKTRVVCLDSIDYRAPFDENGNITEMLPADFENNTYFGTTTASRQYKSGASYWDYSAEQLRWLTEQALTKEDYNYIFVSHMGIDSETNSGGETTNAGYRDKLRNVIEAYQNIPD